MVEFRFVTYAVVRIRPLAYESWMMIGDFNETMCPFRATLAESPYVPDRHNKYQYGDFMPK